MGRHYRQEHHVNHYSTCIIRLPVVYKTQHCDGTGNNDTLNSVLLAEKEMGHIIQSEFVWDDQYLSVKYCTAFQISIKTEEISKASSSACCPAGRCVCFLTVSPSIPLFASILSPPLPILQLSLLFLLFPQFPIPLALSFKLFQPVPVVQKKPRRIQSRSVQTTRRPILSLFSGAYS